MGQPLEVMITVDVETWPRLDDWRDTACAGDIARDIYGATPEGDFGVAYQAELLAERGLKGVFFIEALFACEVGIPALASIVEDVQRSGSEVQLHIHTEWLSQMREPFLQERPYNIGELGLHAQRVVIEKALSNLRAAGAKDVCAYRAGNFGASFETLEVLAELGIEFDSSYNIDYLDKGCGLREAELFYQARPLRGVTEVPVSMFRDYPGHYRPAQLCAASAAEMQSALRAARDQGWKTFVIVSHSFEMLRERKSARAYGQADWSVIRRFEALCDFLAESREGYRTVGFCDLKGRSDIVQTHAKPLHPPVVPSAVRTAGRMASQALRRLPYERERQVRSLLGRVGIR